MWEYSRYSEPTGEPSAEPTGQLIGEYSRYSLYVLGVSMYL